MQEIPDLLKYFPDFEPGELSDREFMWTILSTLREDAVKTIINQVRSNRALSNQEDKQELIEIAPSILNELLNVPHINKGKLDFNNIIHLVYI